MLQFGVELAGNMFNEFRLSVRTPELTVTTGDIVFCLFLRGLGEQDRVLLNSKSTRRVHKRRMIGQRAACCMLWVTRV